MTHPGFDTIALHAGQEPDPVTGARAVHYLGNSHSRSLASIRGWRFRILCFAVIGDFR